MDTVKIKSTDLKTQGDFVIIDSADFDPEKHQKYVESDTQKPKKERKVNADN